MQHRKLAFIGAGNMTRSIVAGLVAVGIALSTIRLWSNTAPEDVLKRRLLFVGVLALGIFQVVRGLGILTAV